MTLHGTAVPAAATGTICQKTRWMDGERTSAQAETDRADKVEFENLARAYLRLAEQAERNSQGNIIYETPPKKDRNQA